MSGLKELRNRIGSVKSTQKITRAMQMVAASKLRRAQEAVEAARPYANRMERVLSSLGSNLTDDMNSHPILVGTGKEDRHLLVVATSERGLCGPFNSSIVRRVRQDIDRLVGIGKTVKLLCIGKKGRDMLRRDHGELILDTIDLASVKKLMFADARPIASSILDLFENEEFDVCTLYFNKFRSVMWQEVTARNLIPAGPSQSDTESGDLPLSTTDSIYEYEPEEDEILAALLPKNISVQIYQALLENAASEQGARMTAMDSATRNAGDMIERLTLSYNRTRQAVITKELIEIISGAEAI